MKTLKTLITLILLTTFASTGYSQKYSQKLKSDGYKISFKSFETQMVGFHSKKRAKYSGTLKVNSKDNQKGIYQFSFLELGDKISLLGFKDSKQNKVLSPTLTFDKESNTFTYYRKTDREGNEKIKDDSSIEETVLSGMLIWLKIEK